MFTRKQIETFIEKEIELGYSGFELFVNLKYGKYQAEYEVFRMYRRNLEDAKNFAKR